jgi:hypothetical protein
MFRDLLLFATCVAAAYFVVEGLFVRLMRFFRWVVNAGNDKA